ncbi:MAG TPA: AI-2E family transporter [Anaerolineales bacterium]
MSEEHPRISPPWSSTTKLVVSLTVVAIAAGVFIQFHGIIGPLLMAFVLAYLFSPLAGVVQRGLRLSWGLSVSLIYLLLFVLLFGLLTLGGLGLVQQISSLVSVVQANLSSLPTLLHNLSGRVYYIGPFQFDLRHMDMTPLSSQVLGMAQSLLGRTGTLLSTIAGGAAQFVGWGSFVILISYFVLSESGGLRGRMLPVDVPGYSEDVRHLSTDLARIWNAFLRGQIIIFLLTSLTYLIVLEVVGVRYAIGLAFLGGLAKFLPYIGPFITWTTLALVAYFQSSTIFGLSPLGYALLVVGLGIVIDQTFDNLVTPRIIAQALRVHPAAVLVAAIISANWLGLLGVILAAPMLATVLLVWRYIVRKMLDLDPWPAGGDTLAPPPPGVTTLARIRRFVRDQIGRAKRAV